MCRYLVGMRRLLELPAAVVVGQWPALLAAWMLCWRVFFLLFGLGGWGRSLRVNSRLLFGRSEALVFILQLLVRALLVLRVRKHANTLGRGRCGIGLFCR